METRFNLGDKVFGIIENKINYSHKNTLNIINGYIYKIIQKFSIEKVDYEGDIIPDKPNIYYVFLIDNKEIEIPIEQVFQSYNDLNNYITSKYKNYNKQIIVDIDLMLK